MDTIETTPGENPEAQKPVSTWNDLLFYLLAGPGVFFGLGILVTHYAGLKPSLLTSAVSYALNVIIFVGAVLLVGIARGRLSAAEIGLAPPRWRWLWLGWALVIVAVLTPIRGVIGLAVELLLHGDLSGLTQGARMQTLVPTTFTWGGFIISLVMAGVMVPFAEELFFRGALYTWFRQHTSVPVAVLASSLLFALAHFDTFVVVITAFILGVVNAILFERTRSIWASFAVHAINNSMAFILLYAVVGLSQYLPQLVK